VEQVNIALLWLPSESWGVTAVWPVPIYTAWCKRVRVNNSFRVVTRQRNGRGWTCDLYTRSVTPLQSHHWA